MDEAELWRLRAIEWRQLAEAAESQTQQNTWRILADHGDLMVKLLSGAAPKATSH